MFKKPEYNILIKEINKNHLIFNTYSTELTVLGKTQNNKFNIIVNTNEKLIIYNNFKYLEI